MAKTSRTANGLNLELLVAEFNLCHPEKDTVLIDHYIKAFTEIARFFECLGPLFSFVAKDVREKVGILTKHREGQSAEHFKTMKSMMEYELENGLTESKSAEGLLSGSRTALRLHRSLAFISDLLRKVSACTDDDAKVSVIAHEAYSNTLAKFHPWIIRKAAGLATYALPHRKRFMETSFKQSEEEAQEILPRFLDISDTIHDEVEELYAKHDMLMLP